MNLSFSNDLTRECREKRKQQYESLKEAKILLERRGTVAVIKGSHIIMNNVSYVLEAIQRFLVPEPKVPDEGETCNNEDSDDSVLSNGSTKSKKSYIFGIQIFYGKNKKIKPIASPSSNSIK